MIITEHRIRDIVAEIPGFDLNADYLNVKPKFGWGDKFELDRYLALKKSDSYPLIWLLPSQENHSEDFRLCRRSCTIIIAMLEKDISLFNDQRYLKSYDLVLNPLTNYLVEGIRAANITYLNEQEDNWDIEKIPNYSENNYGGTEKTSSATIDLWDAVQLDCNIEFNNEPLNKIFWAI